MSINISFMKKSYNSPVLIIICSFLMLATTICHAQEELPILSADRPGNTWGTEVLHWHKVSWENGFAFESSSDEGQAITLNSTIVRYGLFENMELRVGTDFLMFKEVEDEHFSPLSVAPLTIGTKIKVYDGTNILPSVGLLAEFKSPHVGTKDLLPSHLAPSTYLLFENDITDWLSVCYNAGLEWDGETAIPTTFLSLGLFFGISDDIGAFVETYNYIHPEQENQYLTGFGVSWMASHRLQLDLAGDLDFKNLGKYFSVGCGVAWMIN